MFDPKEPRIIRFFMALSIGLIALWATWPLAAQNVPSVLPQTFTLRYDLTETRDPLLVYAQCGQMSKRITTVEPEAVTTTQYKVVDMCDRGHLVLEAPDWHAFVPMAPIMLRDREGTLRGVLLCVKNYTTITLVTYHGPDLGEPPLSCAGAGVPGWRS